MTRSSDGPVTADKPCRGIDTVKQRQMHDRDTVGGSYRAIPSITASPRVSARTDHLPCPGRPGNDYITTAVHGQKYYTGSIILPFTPFYSVF